MVQQCPTIFFPLLLFCFEMSQVFHNSVWVPFQHPLLFLVFFHLESFYMCENKGHFRYFLSTSVAFNVILAADQIIKSSSVLAFSIALFFVSLLVLHLHRFVFFLTSSCVEHFSECIRNIEREPISFIWNTKVFMLLLNNGKIKYIL